MEISWIRACEVTPYTEELCVRLVTPRPEDPLDPALFCQLVPESQPQSQRVPIFCKVGCLAIVVTDSHPPETQTIFLILIFLIWPRQDSNPRSSVCEAGTIPLDHRIG